MKLRLIAIDEDVWRANEIRGVSLCRPDDDEDDDEKEWTVTIHFEEGYEDETYGYTTEEEALAVLKKVVDQVEAAFQEISNDHCTATTVGN